MNQSPESGGQTPSLMVDGGIESFNYAVDELVESGLLMRILAQWALRRDVAYDATRLGGLIPATGPGAWQSRAHPGKPYLQRTHQTSILPPLLTSILLPLSRTEAPAPPFGRGPGAVGRRKGGKSAQCSMYRTGTAKCCDRQYRLLLGSRPTARMAFLNGIR